MSSKKELRPQTLKQPLKVEVKTAVPWMLILLIAAAGAAFVGGWQARSSELTMSDVQWAVQQQLAKK